MACPFYSAPLNTSAIDYFLFYIFYQDNHILKLLQLCIAYTEVYLGENSLRKNITKVIKKKCFITKTFRITKKKKLFGPSKRDIFAYFVLDGTAGRMIKC